MKQYLELVKEIYEDGVQKGDRTGTGTKSLFGRQLRFDMKDGFPAVTTKKLYYESMEAELAWLLRGDTNIKTLTNAKGKHVKIWDAWADDNGDLGPIYGKQWRDWKHYRYHKAEGQTGINRIEDINVDQIADTIHRLSTNPDDRRIIVSAWNVGEIDEMNLPPCHCFFQFWTCESQELKTQWSLHEKDYDIMIEKEGKLENYSRPKKRKLSLQMYQRSCDMFAGVPFNIASYSLLLCIVARQLNMIPYEFIWTGGDCHIYSNHMDQVKEQLSREPFELPELWLDENATVDNFNAGDSKLLGYKHHDAIKAQIAV